MKGTLSLHRTDCTHDDERIAALQHRFDGRPLAVLKIVVTESIPQQGAGAVR